jgi:hypothetical protein
MELIKLVRKRGLIANTLHVVFNLAYVAVIFALLQKIRTPWFETPGFDSLWPALALVLIAKWRVFAVRPRYWLANFLSNLTDLGMGLGIVVLMWSVGATPMLAGASDGDLLAVRIVLALIYAAWLIFLKPLHKHIWIEVQAGVSQFIALAALFAVSDRLWLPLVILLCFGIGFAAARHTLMKHEEENVTLLAMIWGLVVALLGFVAWHSTIGYSVFAPLKIPEMAIIVTALGWAVDRAYDSLIRHQKVRWADIQWPVLFAVVLIGMLLIFFSNPR